MRRSRRGISSITLIVALPTILVATWLGIELGLLIRTLNQAKTAADAAALAAAARLDESFDSYGPASVAAAAANFVHDAPAIIVPEMDNAGGDLSVGRWDPATRQFTPDLAQVDAVAVTVRVGGDAPNAAPGYILPGIIELSSLVFQRTSVAALVAPVSSVAPGLLVLDGGRRKLDVRNGAELDAVGSIGVRSTDDLSVRVDGAAVVRCLSLATAGRLEPGTEAGIDGVVEEDAVVPDDPFLDVPVPQSLGSDDSGLEPVAAVAGGTILQPGYHGNLLSFTGGTVRLEPGLHQFDGAGFQARGDTEIILVDATIQLLGTASFAIRNTCRLTGTPMSQGNWAGFFLVAPDSPQVLVVGDAVIDIPASLYAPEATVDLLGNADLRLDAAVVGHWRQVDDSTATVDNVLPGVIPTTGPRATLRR